MASWGRNEGGVYMRHEQLAELSSEWKAPRQHPMLRSGGGGLSAGWTGLAIHHRAVRIPGLTP